MKVPRLPITALALVAANLAPLFGVLYLGWSIAEVVLLYWVETVIVGLFTLVKMISLRQARVLFYGPFFVVHFSGFMGGHLLFLWFLFLSGEGGHPAAPWGSLARTIALGGLALFASHAFSFVRNWVLGREKDGATVEKLMGQPYVRVVPMHVALVLGGVAVEEFGAGAGLLAILVGLKTVVDLLSHLHAHRERAEREAGAAPA